MTYSLFYFSDVSLDAKEAKFWYKSHQLGLEKRFADTIKSCILKVQENPFNYAVHYRNVRIAHPKVFPYSVHFYIDEQSKQIVIVAIIHNKRNPETVQKRI